MDNTTIFIVILGVVLITALFLTRFSAEGYELRDIPFGLGYGGYPPGLYNYHRQSFVQYPPHVRYGMYGAPDMYAGFNPGVGLTW